MLVGSTGTSVKVQEFASGVFVALLKPKLLAGSIVQVRLGSGVGLPTNCDKMVTVSEIMVAPRLFVMSAMALPAESTASEQLASTPVHWLWVKTPVLPVPPN